MDDSRHPKTAISHQLDNDRLETLGYKPQFKRVLGLFADFSLGYSYMSPMAGLFALFATAVVAGGPPFFWTMIVVLAGQTLVCLVFAEAASEFPIAGGVYQWARHLGGARWGFLTAWIYFLALIGTAAGIAAGGAPFLATLLNMNASASFSATSGVIIAVVAIAANFAGTRILSRMTELGVWTGLAGLAICGVYLLIFARVQPWSILFNTYGLSKGGYLPAALAASLVGIWIFYGFEACGDLAEEVDGASKKVPRAMLLTVLCGGVSALLMTLGLLLAIPNLKGALSGSVTDPAGAALLQGVGPIGSKIALACLIIVVLSGTASVIASASRLLFSLGRDRMIFGHRVLAKVDERRSLPLPALTVVAILTVLVLGVGYFSANAATQIISFATAGIYTAFQMVVAASLLAVLSGWKPAGAFKLGAFGVVVKVGALLFGIAAVLNLAWPRTPSAGWFANWLIVISMAVIFILGIAQIALRARVAPSAELAG